MLLPPKYTLGSCFAWLKTCKIPAAKYALQSEMFFEISLKNLVVFMHVNQAYLIVAIFSTIWNFSSAARHKYRPNFPQSIPCKPYQGTRYLFKNTGRFYKLFWCWRGRILQRNYSALGPRHLLDCQAHS